MDYKLLNNGTGIILDCQPELLNGVLNINFLDAPEGATAIVETPDGSSFYRELLGNSCSIPCHRLEGLVNVTVAIFDGSAHPNKWKCDDLFATKFGEESVLITPNYVDIKKNITDLQIENHRLRSSVADLEKRLCALNERIDDMLEGYDLT